MVYYSVRRVNFLLYFLELFKFLSYRSSEILLIAFTFSHVVMGVTGCYWIEYVHYEFVV